MKSLSSFVRSLSRSKVITYLGTVAAVSGSIAPLATTLSPKVGAGIAVVGTTAAALGTSIAGIPVEECAEVVSNTLPFKK